MIKKLRLKFVLVFLVLVVSVFITSSCYASDTVSYKDNFEITVDEVAGTVTIENTVVGGSRTFDLSEDFKNYSQFYITARTSESFSKVCDFYFWFSNSFQWTYDSIAYGYINYNDYKVIKKGMYYNQDSMLPYNDWGYTNIKDYSVIFVYSYKIDSSDVNYTTSNKTDLVYSNHTIYGRADTSKVLYAPAVDTTFNYSLNGIKRGQVELKIENLDSSLNMYGYVGCKNNFNIGDTLDTGSISSYLRLLSMYSDLSCTLYEGEKLLYYIVDENNIILDIGYISELAEGYFLYGFPVSDGVDFVFLKDGQVYWNNNLTFKYQADNGDLLTKNEIVSTGSYSYIESNKTLSKINYNGFVYDISGEMIALASTSTTNDLSSPVHVQEISTNYYENYVGNNKSCYWIYSILLAGTDYVGNNIDFSNYSVRWSIPTWLTIDSIEVNDNKYDKYNGTITGFSSNGYLRIDLKIYELLKNHTANFDIKLEIYNENGDLILTYLVNSDDIVKDQILNNENNIDKPSYDITDNPGYTGGSGNKDFSNIQNWTSDDYLNLMSTDNFIWEFFKAILGNLPWWITVPITILMFGVVIITLIRFARGA